MCRVDGPLIAILPLSKMPFRSSPSSTFPRGGHSWFSPIHFGVSTYHYTPHHRKPERMLYRVLDRQSPSMLAAHHGARPVPKGSAFPDSAFVDEEAREIFDNLDGDHAGKVMNVDFQINKINALFSRHRAGTRPTSLMGSASRTSIRRGAGISTMPNW